MATQLADRGPNPDLRSGKFGPWPTVGLNSDLHFSLDGTDCLPSVRGARNPHQIAETTFFFGLQSLFRQQISVKTFFWSTLAFSSSNCGQGLFWTKRLFICNIWTFAKTSWVPLVYSIFNSMVLRFICQTMSLECYLSFYVTEWVCCCFIKRKINSK